MSRLPMIPAWFVSIGLAHCVEPIDAPSAFSEQNYLCDAVDAAKFDARLEQCRQEHAQDGSCVGLISLRGTIDTVPVVLSTYGTAISQLSLGGSAPDGFAMSAPAPYFALQLTFLHSAVASGGGGVAALDIGRNDFINLEARGGNYLSNLVNETRNVTVLTADEVAFTFSTDLARGGHIDGCLHVFLPLH